MGKARFIENGFRFVAAVDAPAVYDDPPIRFAELVHPCLELGDRNVHGVDTVPFGKFLGGSHIDV